MNASQIEKDFPAVRIQQVKSLIYGDGLLVVKGFVVELCEVEKGKEALTVNLISSLLLKAKLP